MNLCLEGRCEVWVPGSGFAVVKEGDCCISGSNAAPDDYRYPLGRYRGVELFVRTDAACDPALALLNEAPVSLEAFADDAGFAAVFSGNDSLNAPLRRIGDAMASYVEAGKEAGGRSGANGPLLRARIKSDFVGLALALASCDIRHARPGSLLTRSQIALAMQTRAELESDLALPHDARAIARRHNVSAATLNNYFLGLYGTTIASYLRQRRMEQACALLGQGRPVTTVALAVGYANPSKFAAAFKRVTGQTPSEYQQNARLGPA